MKKNDIIAGCIFIAVGVFIFTQTITYPSLEKGHPGPGLFPNLLALLFIAFGGTLVWKARRPSSQEELEPEAVLGPRRLSNAFYVIGIVVVYVLIVDYLGFLITSAVLLSLLMKKLRVSLWKSVAASIAITLFINILFSKILRVPLPYGILGW
jgi:putative tricarboxylic transport membrane protein